MLYFAHLARCAAAIFLLAAALIVRFPLDVAPFDDDSSSKLAEFSIQASSFSLIDAARLSCWGVRSVMFMIVSTTPKYRSEQELES